MNRYSLATPHSFGTMKRDDRFGLWAEVKEVERLLEKLMALAGAKNADAGCAAVIAECRKAMQISPNSLDGGEAKA